MEQFICRAAIEGLEARKAEVQRQLDDANKRYQEEVLGHPLSRKAMSSAIEKDGVLALLHKTVDPTAKPKRKISAAGRKAIAAAQKARWAKFHKAQKKGGKK